MTRTKGDRKIWVQKTYMQKAMGTGRNGAHEEMWTGINGDKEIWELEIWEQKGMGTGKYRVWVVHKLSKALL